MLPEMMNQVFTGVESAIIPMYNILACACVLGADGLTCKPTINTTTIPSHQSTAIISFLFPVSYRYRGSRYGINFLFFF